MEVMEIASPTEYSSSSITAAAALKQHNLAVRLHLLYRTIKANKNKIQLINIYVIKINMMIICMNKILHGRSPLIPVNPIKTQGGGESTPPPQMTIEFGTPVKFFFDICSVGYQNRVKRVRGVNF